MQINVVTHPPYANQFLTSTRTVFLEMEVGAHRIVQFFTMTGGAPCPGKDNNWATLSVITDRHGMSVLPLPYVEHHGDWHDKPSRWMVVGPGTELQKFSTRKEADLYRRLRRSAKSDTDAMRAYINT